MMKKIEPSEIGKNPDLIAKAQKEMAQSDILVCGKCHNVFHFIDLFKEHKSNNCKRTSAFKDCRETRPKIWAYLLWKQTQFHQNQENSGEDNPWKLYQQWMSLDESIRQSWLVAGGTIQSFEKFGNGILQETPVKITKTLTPEKPVITRPSPIGQVVKRVVPTSVPVTPSPTRVTSNVIVTEQKVIRRADDGTLQEKIVISPKTQRLINRTDPVNGKIEMSAVDKIMAKRMNPRKRENEYLVKWESKPQTWEPASHLESCKDLIENFEILLAKQKEMRAKSQLTQQTQPTATSTPTPVSAPVSTPTVAPTTPNRPERSSKQKAINQVKQWTGGNKHHDDSAESPGTKRKAQDEDDEFDEDIDGDDVDDEDYELESSWEKKKMAQQLGQTLVKKIKTDASGQNGNVRIVSKTPGSGSDMTIGATIVRKVVGTKSPDVIIAGQKQMSGVFKKASPSTAPVVTRKPGEGQVRIVDKKDQIQSGIVRVNQQAGVVASPNIAKTTQVVTRVVTKPSPQAAATRPGNVVRTVQTVQSQQKALAQKIIQRSPMNKSQQSPVQRTQTLPKVGPSPVVRKSGGAPAQVVRKSGVVQRIVKKVQVNEQDDDDDGIQDPFPKDLPPIETESASPPPPLTLCPITGKVLGQPEGEVEQADDQESDQHQITQLLSNEDGTPIYITGDDGTMYQVAGKNAKGETILVSTNAEGEQTCVLLPADQDLLAGLPGIQTSDVTEVEDGRTPLTVDAAVAEAVSAAGEQQQDEQFFSKEGDEASQTSTSEDTAVTQPLSVAVGGESGDSQDGQITAEIVQADDPSPGGTRKVVLMLPDGNLMVTELSSDQFQSLNLQQ